jgi:chemotaxis protein histidine kinase CheA
LCDTVTTDEGVQRGKIMIMDILIAVDGITMKQGVDNIPWVREHILGDPGTAVELDLLRGDGAQFSSRYHVSLVRAGAQPSCQKSNEEFLGMQIKNLLARIQEQLGRIQELETNKDSLKSLLAQREKDLLETETRHAVRDSEARNALNDAQSLKQELAAAKKAAAEANTVLAKAEAAAAATIKELETNDDCLKSLLEQRENDLLNAETRYALRDAEARSALNDAQSLKQELAAAKNAAAEANTVLAKAEAAAAATIKELETNDDCLKSLLAQRENDLLNAETRYALRDAEARSALRDAQSLFKRDIAAAEKAAAEANVALAKAQSAAAAAQEKVASDSASRSLYLMRRALAMFKNRACSKAMGHWKECATEIRRMKTISNRVVLRWTHGCLASVMSKWQHEIVRGRKALKAVKMWSSKALAVALRRWIDTVCEIRRMKALTNRVVKRWTNGCLASVMSKWQHEIVRGRKALKAVKMWSNKALAASLRRWIDSVCEIRRMKALTNRVVKRWTNGCLANVVSKWQHEIVRGRKALKAVKMWSNKALAASLRRWIEYLARQRQLKNKAFKVVLRMQNAALVLSFERWWDHIIEEKQLQNKALKVVQRMQNGALVLSFERWRDHIIEEKQLKNKTWKVVQRMLKGGLVSAFERWREHVIEEKQLKSKALKVELNAWHRTTLVA